MTPLVRTAAAAVLLAVPVALETLVSGVSDAWWGHALFATAQLVGWLVLLSVVGDLRAAVLPTTRAGRAGARLVQAACLLELLFAVSYGATAAVTGDPLEATFVLFALGFLALTLGGMTWGVHLLRRGASRAGGGLVAVASLGVVAIVVAIDPWHDLALLGSYVAWVIVGLGAPVSARARRPARAAASLSA